MDKYLNVMNQTALAEFGSALEMLAACKKATKASTAFGYFQHAKDEFIHVNTFLEIMANHGKKIPSEIARIYRFNSNSLINNGYVSNNGYLIETMKLKDFIAYVYTNELLAKESFEEILDLVNPSSVESKYIKQIMNDELRHHGLAKKHFLKYYPLLQPWQLRLYKLREIIKNKGRKLYDKNLKILDKLLTPLYFSMAFIVGRIILFINLNEFKRKDKNLMEINPKSII